MDSANGANPGANQNFIELIEACGEWFVRVVEDGKEDSRSFELKSYALAFVEGQRIRLRLDKVVRL